MAIRELPSILQQSPPYIGISLLYTNILYHIKKKGRTTNEVPPKWIGQAWNYNYPKTIMTLIYI